MKYKNGYKVVYEVAANGERTFYATKSNAYPPRDAAGNIIEDEMNTKLATFKDADYLGKTIYEHEGKFYVANTTDAKFDADGNPIGTELKGFDAILVETTPAEPTVIDTGDDGNNDPVDPDAGNDDGDAGDDGDAE